MTDKTTPNDPELNGDSDDATNPETVAERDAPTVPSPYSRPADLDRRIRSAVESMIQDVQNPYETVVVAAQEARRINDRKLKARSIINQALEHVEELVPEVPFVPRPVEDEEPEIKATNEAMEKMACGLVDYEVEGQRKTAGNYYGEIDFPTDPHDHEPSEEESAEGP